MASLEEVWGTPFPKKGKISEKSGVPIRDAETEARVFANPSRRTEAAEKKHKGIIDELSASLPIAETKDQMETNFYPAPAAARREQRNNIEPFSTQYAPVYGGAMPEHLPGSKFAYAPTKYEDANLEQKIDKILRMIDQNKTGYETPTTNDMLLYIFTGMFFLFTLDTFVTIGRKL